MVFKLVALYVYLTLRSVCLYVYVLEVNLLNVACFLFCALVNWVLTYFVDSSTYYYELKGYL